MKKFAILIVCLVLIGWSVLPVSGQAVVTAQIETFWRQIANATSSRYFTTLGMVVGGHINFGTTLGDSGYGLRDSGGVIQIKNSGGTWATPAAGAVPTATFLLQTANGGLPNAQALGALGTGLVFNTTTTGVQSIYAGTSCAGQFPRSLNASGVATCQSVALGSDVTGTLLAAQFPALTGDVTTSAGALATTLATVNAGVGTFGSATAIPQLTVNAKGLITAIANVTPQLTITSTYFSSLSGANLTGVPTSALTGAVLAANFPALTGDVTSAGATLATTVGAIGGKTVTLGGNFTTSGAFNTTLTVTGATNVTLPSTGTLVSTTVTALSSLVTVGTITTGTWNGTVVGATYGGTGINNGASTITLGGALSFSGAFTTAFTVTGNTTVTLPTTGTLVNTAVTTLSSLTTVGTLTTLASGTHSANVAGTPTLGTVALPFASVIVGTAATNNLSITPAAFAQGTVATVDDPGLAAVKLALVRRGTITFTSGAVTNGTCSTPVTVAVTGLAATSTVVASFNTALQTNWQKGPVPYVYPTANTVNLTVCNPTAGSITPETQTFNFTAFVP
jgi:hypothetical protein